MRIVIDKVILGAREAFERLGEVEAIAAKDINEMSWRDIDVLLVRSKCPVTAAKIKGSKLQFIGTATAGFDHVDIEALEREGISYGHAPGCNAESVVDYVIASLCYLSLKTGDDFRNRSLGIVGCGQTGGRLARRLKHLDVDLNLCDPPLAKKGKQVADLPWKSLREVLSSSEILSLHVPLIEKGNNPTFHMLAKQELEDLGQSSWLINACRGEVISSDALWNHLPEKLSLDVWENEPLPHPDLVQVADVASAHVAGHSVQGKINGTVALRKQVCKIIGNDSSWDSAAYLKNQLGIQTINHHLDSSCSPEKLLKLAVDAYDLDQDDRNLRACVWEAAVDRGSAFQSLRSNYRIRQDFGAQVVHCDDPHLRSTIEGLGFKLG